MIHNLLPNRDRVYITYTLDFIPDTSTGREGDPPGRAREWLDVEGGKAYPVFDVASAAAARTGASPTPTTRPTPTAAAPRATRRRSSATACSSGPPATSTRAASTPTSSSRATGARVNLFRSRAKYWEPAGAVSWDVAMTATRPNWRVAVKRGDVLSVSATYDSKRASWYESMGIMPVAFAAGAHGGVDPFSAKLERRGVLTHGRLRENRNHGGKRGGLKDPRTMSAVPASTDPLAITDFLYGQGDLLRGGAASRPPQIAPGQSLTFVNRDAAKTIYHTITACRAPCNRTTGIAYPLADGPVDFDSGELGFGPQGFTAAANRDTWSTPTTLGDGTYTYFCRVHPFMRGSFRVKG